MKTFLIVTLFALGIVNISCSDKNRILMAEQNGKVLPNGTQVPVLLSQNFPNPFNPSTSILFRVATRMKVTLDVKTEDWVNVATLVDTVEPAGTYIVRWDPKNLPSGEYLAVLGGDGVTEAIRMRFIK